MKLSTKILLLSAFTLLLSACSRIVPPHVAVKCKFNYDKCMIKNTFKGPLQSHDICMAERASECR